jgi:hypothetical protein
MWLCRRWRNDVPESLAEWYAGFMARREARRGQRRARPPGSGVGTAIVTDVKLVKGSSGRCTKCGVNPIAQGKSKTSRYIRSLKWCHACYRWELEQGDRLPLARRPRCTRCGVRPISQGASYKATKAKEAGLCLACYGTERRGRQRGPQAGG